MTNKYTDPLPSNKKTMMEIMKNPEAMRVHNILQSNPIQKERMKYDYDPEFASASVTELKRGPKKFLDYVVSKKNTCMITQNDYVKAVLVSKDVWFRIRDEIDDDRFKEMLNEARADDPGGDKF